MTVTVVVGTQYGDEGKGKLIDVFSINFDNIARFQGGNNAGHTIVNNGDEYILHFIPSSVLHKNKFGIIGDGVCLNPKDVLEEIKELGEKGIKVTPMNFGISLNAGLIFDYHKWLDGFSEEERGDNKIGTTGKGIGPAYTDRISRCGIRFSEFLDEELFRELAEKPFHNAIKVLQTREIFDFNEFLEGYKESREFLSQFAINATDFLKTSFEKNESLLIEGAQGTCLDVFGGNVPYVTSSSTVAGNACVGLPIGPRDIDNIIGVMKAYITRVGEGPLITLMESGLEERIREKGGEFGATTGRPRRCGWADIPIMRYAIQKNSLDEIALTKLDVLSGCSKIKMCVSYNNGRYDMPPFFNRKEVENCEPDYIEFPGWRKDISNVKVFEDLPQNARDYVKRLEDFGGVPINVISVGPDRDQTITRD